MSNLHLPFLKRLIPLQYQHQPLRKSFFLEIKKLSLPLYDTVINKVLNKFNKIYSISCEMFTVQNLPVLAPFQDEKQ